MEFVMGADILSIYKDLIHWAKDCSEHTFIATFGSVWVKLREVG